MTNNATRNNEFRLIGRTATYNGRPREVQRCVRRYEQPDGQQFEVASFNSIHRFHEHRSRWSTQLPPRPLPPPSTPTRPTHDTRDGVDDGS